MIKKNIIFGILLIIVDQLIKVLMINVNMDIIPNILKFTYVENTGVAFGIASGSSLIIAFNILLIIAIVIYIILNKEKIKVFSPYALLISGAISNLIDRIFRGFVVDYIDILNFPCFNIADCLIVIGIILICIFLVMKKKDT